MAGEVRIEAQGGRCPHAGKLVKPGHLEEVKVVTRVLGRLRRKTNPFLRLTSDQDVIEGENPVCGRKGALYVAPSTSRVVWECSSKWEGRDCNQTCSRCSAGLLTGLLAALQASIVWCRWIRLEECSSLGSVIASCDAASAGREHSCWDPKDGELCLNRVKPEETLVEARSGSDVQIDRQIWV
ncbi:UNVERIFIED_CONTAM: hypothetical protein Scaly_3040200 [Sesamum calycinum]|uniref:Uncharacterized protein n=1 Tax=Sesamum calycinum TaxID=2727403 RepID=A0AAW2K6Z3_9LAMI